MVRDSYLELLFVINDHFKPMWGQKSEKMSKKS